MNKLTASIGVFALLTFTHVPSWAGDLTIPHDFVSGTPAVAGEVNANFDAVETAVDDNNARITTNEADITTNKADIATNKGDIATNKGDITDLKTGLGANAVTVNCGTDTIGAALAAAIPGGGLVITVNGTCTENVTIIRDDVTLLSGAAGAIVGEVLIDGARRAVIDGLTVSGAGNGILAQRNATVTVQNSTIQNNTLSGVWATQGAFAFIDNNTIQSNGECEVLVNDVGHARLVNNIITSGNPDANNCSAIGAFGGGFVRLRGGNTVTNTTATGFAIDVFNGALLRQSGGGHDTVSAMAVAVEVGRQSYADFRDVDITGKVEVFSNSILHLRDVGTSGTVTVTGNIDIFGTAVGNFASTATVSGNVTCFGSGAALGTPTFVSGMLIGC